MSLEGGQGSSPASVYSAEANTVFAAMTVMPIESRKKLIDEVIIKLVADGVWAKLDCLYLFAAHNEQAAKINWINPGTFDATNLNTNPFETDNGFIGNGTTSWVDTNFDASTAGGQYTQDDATMFAWGGQANLLQAGLMGFVTGSNSYIYPFGVADSYYMTINGDGGLAPIEGASSDGRGFWSVTRRTSTTVEAYKNGASLGSITNTSEALMAVTHVFLRTPAEFYVGPVLAGGLGAGLSDAEHTSLYDALHPYLQALAMVP